MIAPRFAEVQQRVLDHGGELAFPCIVVGCAGDVPQDRFIAAVELLQRIPDKHRLTRQNVWTLATAFLCEKVHHVHNYGRDVEKCWRDEFSHLDFRRRRTLVEPNAATPKRPIASAKRHVSGPSQVPRGTASPPTIDQISPTPGARRKSCPGRPNRRTTSSASPGTSPRSPLVSLPESSRSRYSSLSQVRPEQHVKPSSAQQSSSSLDEAQADMSNTLFDRIIIDDDFEVAQHESRGHDTVSLGSSSDDSLHDQSFNEAALQDMVSPALALAPSNAEDSTSADQPILVEGDFFTRRNINEPPELFRCKVFKRLKDPLLHTPATSKYIYAIPHRNTQLTFVKIGIAGDSHDRFHELYRQHKRRHIDKHRAWTLGEKLTDAEARRLEQLVQRDLAYHRYTLCQFDGPTVKKHTEWFQIDLETAKRTIKLWRKIMERYGLKPDTVPPQELRMALDQLEIKFGKLATRGDQEDWQRANEDHDARIQWWIGLLLDSPQTADHEHSPTPQTPPVGRTDTSDLDGQHCLTCRARISSTTIHNDGGDSSIPPPSTRSRPSRPPLPPSADCPAPSQAQALALPPKSHSALTLSTALPWLVAVAFVSFLPRLLNIPAFIAWALQVLSGMFLGRIAWLHFVEDTFVAS